MNSTTSQSSGSAAAKATTLPPAKKKILLVDDDPTVRDSLNDVLVGEDYFVISAENGQQALDLAELLGAGSVHIDYLSPQQLVEADDRHVLAHAPHRLPRRQA